LRFGTRARGKADPGGPAWFIIIILRHFRLHLLKIG
jgi:hypothetical protein